MSPTWIIRRIVDGFHVSTPFADVAADLAFRADRGGMAPRARSIAITQALIAHRQNRAQYAWVMGDHS